MPEITVVIPAHNEEKLITSAVRSVLVETTPDIEVLVVLDRCTDQTARAVLELGDRRARCIVSEGPPGIAGALNTGLQQARSPLVARLDADDVQCEGRLEKQMRRLRRDGLDVCSGWARLRLDDGHELLQATPTGSDEIRAALRRANVIVHSSVLFRRDRVLRLGGYRDLRWEDYDLWVRGVQADLRFGCVPEVVVIRQLRSAGLGERQGHSLLGRVETLRHRMRATLATGGWLPW